MKNIKLLLLIAIIFAVQSCNDSSNPVISINENFIYPLKIGNRWNYHISNTFTNIRPDSIKNKLNDFFFDVQVSVNNDTIINSIPVIEMKEESKDYPDSYAYYSNSESGFLEHAYRTSGHNGLPKKNSTGKYLFKGKYFYSISEIINNYTEKLLNPNTVYDSLIIFQQPRVIFKYPLVVGSEWEFSREFVFINKEITGKTIIKTSLGSFECFQIMWKYDFNMDGNWDEDFVLYEYLCSKGVIKYTYTIKDITITSIEHPEGIGKADVKYERVITSTNF